MSPWLFSVYMDGVMKEVKMGMGRKVMRFLVDGREWRLLGLLYADDLVLYGESEKDLRKMVGRFAEVCRRRGLKANAGKIKVMVLNGEEGLECEVHLDGIRLEHVSKFKYFVCVLEDLGTDEADCSRKVASGRMVAGVIMFLVNTRDLLLECARILHETLLLPVLVYGSETVTEGEGEI